MATYQVISSLADIATADWDRLANPPGGEYNPSVSHAFLHALERSGSATRKTGWLAQHLLMEEDGKFTGLVPCYLKSHSYGEYVFDHAWADAYRRAGGSYYPKLQASVPFTPVPGPRLCAPDTASRLLLARGLEALCKERGASSVHVTFHSEDLADLPGWTQRTDIQFHWHNQDYRNFDDFLDSLASRKRKNVRKERQQVREAGISFDLVTGSDLREHHWDAFFEFYQDTGSRKWGTPYLTRNFFSLLGEMMPKGVLLVMAKRQGRYIAGALNLVGSTALFGRNWGAVEHHPCLHFETCYYQAIAYAIDNRLSRVEAGAQGEHKLARGYMPVTTHSQHYFSDKRLGRAVADYLEQERAAIADDQAALVQHSPFKANMDHGDF